MKNILHIALAFTFVVSCAGLTSAQIRPTGSGPRIFRLPSGGILILPTRPLPPLVQPISVLKPLPPWATATRPLQTPPLLQPRLFPTPSKPGPVFGNPLPPKLNTIDNFNKIVRQQKINEMAGIVTNGIIRMLSENEKKNINRLYIPNPSLDNLTSFKADVSQNRPASNNSSPFVAVTSNLDKPAAPRVQSSPSPQLTNSGLTTNSSLKVVHVTADGTAILIDGQNNYYSLPLNNVRNNQENVSSGVTKPAEQKQIPRRNHSRSRN